MAGAAALGLLVATPALAHGVGGGDAAFLASAEGWQLGPYFYLGAKHMLTGYDHLLFLLGLVFFLTRMRDVALYVTMFSLGHSATLLAGVLAHVSFDPRLVDAVIGLSVVYKAVDNLGGFRRLGVNPRVAVLAFGLVHGFGLATKLQDLQLSANGLVPNMIAFNVGVELGQLLALSFILMLMTWWRGRGAFRRQGVAANLALATAGFVLFQHQLVGHFIGATP